MVPVKVTHFLVRIPVLFRVVIRAAAGIDIGVLLSGSSIFRALDEHAPAF